jgi:four helix bundle protein
MTKGDDIQERLIDFAVELIKLSSSLPKSRAGNHVAKQLLRSGTSPAANYGEARGAESRNDFIHKLRIVVKELNESIIWLEILKCSEMQTHTYIEPILIECTELAKIISSSIKTVGKRAATVNS